jgi:DNA (cytosine-5)-methyltransferase 1
MEKKIAAVTHDHADNTAVPLGANADPVVSCDNLRNCRPQGSVVDLFCGAGGLAHGFYLEGYHIGGGIDIDEKCRFPFEYNNNAPFLRKDVSELELSSISEMFLAGEPKILVGCAPCQPFSTYNHKNSDPRWQLVDKFADLICDLLPDIVSMENVSRLLKFQGGDPFLRFVQRLKNSGYCVFHKVVFAPDYGVPQRRSRLVVLASRLGPIELNPPKEKLGTYNTVQGAIGHLRPLTAGGVDPDDPMHRASRLSDTNLERIRASKQGGSWRDWREDLIAECHRSKSGGGYVSVYGRVQADAPAPTITTQFFGFGNGRFGHFEQDRGLSLREGAILQTFPESYAFVRPGDPILFKSLGRLIGNAVPVMLGRVIASSIRAHVAENSK